MRILLLPMGSAGDVHPFIGIGVELQKRGHEVIALMNEHFKSATEKAGLRYVEFGTAEDFRRISDDPDLWHPKKALGVVFKKGVFPTLQPAMDLVAEHHKPGETVLLSSTLGLAARCASEKLDIPLVTCHLAPSVFVSIHRSPKMEGAPLPDWAPKFWKRLVWRIALKITDGIICPELNAFRAKHGLSPVKHILHWWHSKDRLLGLWPEWFGLKQPDWPSHTVLTGFPMFDEAGQHEVSGELEDFLQAGDPPVVFAPGSANSHGASFFADAVKICERTSQRGILLTPYAGSIPTKLPDTVKHFDYVPFSEVLPRSAALVHHGGIGTTAQCMRAGIPNFIRNLAHDQLDNLSRVRELGVGDGMHARKFNAKSGGKMLRRLLGDERVKIACKEVAARFRPSDWMAQTVAEIESIKLEPTPTASSEAPQ
ncbi:glycosyltransferase [Planctomycetota bacterium]|nr:glycosyltransferase [Planctomycetota bacterium]